MRVGIKWDYAREKNGCLGDKREKYVHSEALRPFTPRLPPPQEGPYDGGDILIVDKEGEVRVNRVGGRLAVGYDSGGDNVVDSEAAQEGVRAASLVFMPG